MPTRPTTHDGFFVGLATNTSMPQYQETYISDGQYMSFDIKAARAQSGLDYATAGMSSLEYLSTGGEGQYVMSGLPVSIQRTELGYNAYMEWGYWTQPNTMTDGTMAYLAFDNKGYYVWGDKTASLPSSFSGTFSGPARGTIYATGGGQDLTGNFSMNVTWNGSTGSISNFSALVGTAGANLTGISGASGTFNSTGVYTLTNGTWWVNNQSGTSATAVGSFYGPDAKLTGGVWKVEKAGTAHANGLFVGSRP